MDHDHEQFPDLTDPKRILLACNCFCETCYSEEQRQSEGTGCICKACFCAKPVSLHPAYYKDTPQLPSVTPDDNTPHGTCRKCAKNTYRKGTRGRFPVLCEACK